MERKRPSVRGIWVKTIAIGMMVTLTRLVGAGCGSDSQVVYAPPLDAGIDHHVGDKDAGDGGVVDSGCTPKDIDCTGKCGPVTDICSGNVKACGGCDPVTDSMGMVIEQRVCDEQTNTCIKPKITCADLGAECGTVRDSCGEYLDCPDTNPKGCPTGEECNPDTHKCQDCEVVSCQDLGYECGFAWLGCGQDTPTNYTDCGKCAPGADTKPRTCNDVFHVCEPTCVAAPAATVCAAAMAKDGVQCGIISDGCGGTVNCDTVKGFGCAAGQSCGVRGIANRCDAQESPEECKIIGKNCGDLISACTNAKVHCGDCAMGEVCNSNDVCGKPCMAKTCDVDFPGVECGTFDDGCGSTVTCGKCASGVCDQTTNKCCALKTCAVDYKGECGTGLADNCSKTGETCACPTTPTAETCTTDGKATAAPPAGTPGMCCTPITAATYIGKSQCGTGLADGCGKNTISAPCAAGKDCVNNTSGAPGPAPPAGTTGTCCTRTDNCNGITAGTCGSVPESCRPGTNVACTNKCTTPNQCVTTSGVTSCCTPAPACTLNGGEGGECNDAEPANGCGSDRKCNCAGGRVCLCKDHTCTATDGAGVCTTALACTTTYKAECGTSLTNGVGGTINCGCPTGEVCSTSVAGKTGTCACNNPTGVAYTCANVPNGPTMTGGDACGTFDNGCGSTISCLCPTKGDVCNTTANPNKCCAPAVCPAAPAVGTACGTIDNGCTSVKCGCPSGAGNENFSCSTTTSKCECEPDTCRGRTGAQPDRCGGTLQCKG